MICLSILTRFVVLLFNIQNYGIVPGQSFTNRPWSVIINNVEYYVTEENGEFVKALSPLHIQKRFEKIAYAEMVLRHTSAYDEMCGQPEKISSNLLEVP